ncbi:TIGR03894 family protein [Prochlorococcus marinus]|uniref:TIGR03894 family protein n=1 Tax=Prochlorococcus marinus TaxID=1219 RepID=UPI0022B50BD0|nr:TIGR03894 family protein [Prochlorococcus marinus]
MVTDKALLKEVTKELWQSVKKLRPELGKDPRMQLVLKALITIGDLPDSIQAAMVVATCLEMEDVDESPNQKEENPTTSKSSQSQEASEGKRTVRRRSAAN